MTPAATATLVKKGFTINVEDGAGLESKFRNEDYASAGAKVVDKNAAFHSGEKAIALEKQTKLIKKSEKYVSHRTFHEEGFVLVFESGWCNSAGLES